MMTTRSATVSMLRIGIAVLTFGTALIHLQLNFPDPVFILNASGTSHSWRRCTYPCRN